MIARIWHGTTLIEHYDEYWRFLHQRAIPDYQATPGNLGVRLLRRIDDGRAHFLTMSFWNSLDDVRAFAGDEVERAKYYPEDAGYLLEFEPKVLHYEISAG